LTECLQHGSKEVINEFTACTARQIGLSVQFMVVYQCNVAQANMTAFFVDGSTLSNLQVSYSVSLCDVGCGLASKLTACMSTACMPSIVKMACISDPICLICHLHECNHASYFPARIAAMVSQVLLACQQDHVIITQEMCNMPIFIHHEQVNFARAAY
jgi:hypothetical protein